MRIPRFSCRFWKTLLAGRSVQLNRLFPDEALLAGARRRLDTIHRQAQANFDEKGLSTLFAGVGLATWAVERGGRPNAPVILVPISVAPTDAARWNFKIEVSGDLQLNPVLVHVLGTEHGVDASTPDMGLSETIPQTFAGLISLLGNLRDRWSAVRGLEIAPRMVLGNFNYANMAMVEDLENSLETFAGNELVAAIAGVEEARQALAAKIQDPSPRSTGHRSAPIRVPDTGCRREPAPSDQQGSGGGDHRDLGTSRHWQVTDHRQFDRGQGCPRPTGAFGGGETGCH